LRELFSNGRKAKRALLLLCMVSSTCGSPTTLRPPERSRAVASAFLRTPRPPNDAYEMLFLYFLEGFQAYRNPEGSVARYPGLPSTHGAEVDAMEGFTRFAPLAAAWIRSGRNREVLVPTGERVDLVALLRNGIVSGTNPASRSFWGEIGDHDQRLCEAADVALALWLTRQSLWTALSRAEQSRVSGWLRHGARRQVADNNWHLMVVVISLVLRDLGEPSDIDQASRHYERFKTFYRGDGWFSDGPGKVFDYYNAWAIHYQLHWINQICPSWDPAFIASSRDAFLATYRRLIARDGVPILGRSVCYRGAVASPIVLGVAAGSGVVSSGEARRALDVTWQAFIRKGVLDRGGISQGYCGPDPRVLDNYSGPASCLWSLRSLIAALSLPSDSPFWRSAPQALPIDIGDYRVPIAATNWVVVGDSASGSVTILVEDALPSDQTLLSGESTLDRIKTLVLSRPHRPRNVAARYRRGTYSSAAPFTECVVP